MLLAFLQASGQGFPREVLSQFSQWPLYKEIESFYAMNNYRYAWLESSEKRLHLRSLLQKAAVYGLKEQDYQYSFLNVFTFSSLKTVNDSVEADARFTDAALHFFKELKTGNQSPGFRYSGIAYNPQAEGLVTTVYAYLHTQNPDSLIDHFQPVSKEYRAILSLLNQFQSEMAMSSVSDAKVISKKADTTNKILLQRLQQLGFIDSAEKIMTNKEVVVRLKKAQRFFDLSPDGVLGTQTLKALNVSLKRRVAELSTALNYLRWLEEAKRSKTVLVLNIPSANFILYDHGREVLQSKIIAGKPSTPTPTLTSAITEVILYPYWTVPNSIATKELLPAIKKNIGYLKSGNYQVINKQGKVLNPYAINWRSLGPGNFPYIIRQSTGCDNALGIVKFNFYNPFTVYLHDTPGKTLFSYTKRFYSHGCMRVEKPIQLAQFILGENRIAIDTLTAKGCVNQQLPKAVAVKRPVALIILYSTAWINKEDDVVFYEDVYGKLD